MDSPTQARALFTLRDEPERQYDLHWVSGRQAGYSDLCAFCRGGPPVGHAWTSLPYGNYAAACRGCYPLLLTVRRHNPYTLEDALHTRVPEPWNGLDLSSSFCALCGARLTADNRVRWVSACRMCMGVTCFDPARPQGTGNWWDRP